MLDLQVKQITIPENCNIHTYSLFCLVVLAVGNLRKPLLLVTYRNQAILHFHFSLKSRKEKHNKKEKLQPLFSNMKWSKKMKFNTIFMYDACPYDMYNYDIKNNAEFLYGDTV